jgi:hypothetical protein
LGVHGRLRLIVQPSAGEVLRRDVRVFRRDRREGPMVSSAGIEFRTVRNGNAAQYCAYLRLFWDIPVGLNRYFTRRSDELIENWMRTARADETDLNTFSGIALHRGAIVGVHILRAYEGYERLGSPHCWPLGARGISGDRDCAEIEGEWRGVGAASWRRVSKHKRPGRECRDAANQRKGGV